MRKYHLFIFLVVFIGVIFIVRLYYLQIYEDKYKLMADSNTRRDLTIYPPRGYIYDRNDSLVVSNHPAYNLSVTYSFIEPFDTLALSSLLDIPMENLRGQFQKFDRAIRNKKHSRHQPFAIVSQISVEDYPRIQEKIYKYPGLSIEKTTMRRYHYPNAANVLGFLSEISSDASIKDNPDYKLGDILGATGVEKIYERELRGIPGHRYAQIDVTGKITGNYMEGQFDSDPIPGKNINISLDIELQKYGELLMSGKRGSIIAIEPSSGEILAMVTAPSYDPALLSGRARSKNYALLAKDPAKPMFDRGLIAEYAPGSPWKIVTGLAALHTGAVTSSFTIVCGGGFRIGNHRMNCLCNTSYPLDMVHGYQHSCNTYFATIYKRTIENNKISADGLQKWWHVATSLGFGQYLGTDLSTGRRGHIPSTDFYDKVYGKGRWGANTTISNAIGQGEITVTPMQLANLTAIVANGGYYFRPHIIKSIGKGSQAIDSTFTTAVQTGISREHFEVVKEGMANVFRAGTARAYTVPEFDMCGKTGTVENFAKIGGKRVKLVDHSMFVAFAPKDNPKIAIAVVVENGKWGARWAAPIASLMIEKYILGQSNREYLEKMMIEGSLEDVYKMYEVKSN